MSTERPINGDEADDEADDGARAGARRDARTADGRAGGERASGERAPRSAPSDDAAEILKDTPPGSAGPKTAGPDRDEAPRSADGALKRRRSRLAVASVAAAVLLAGGGGAYLAANASGGQDGAAGAGGDGGDPPPLALDGYAAHDSGAASSPSDSGSGGPGASGRPTGIAPGEPDPNGAQGTLYRAAKPLPGGPSSAAVYRATGSVTQAQVSRLAKALHVDGAPRLSGSSWLVGSVKDGSGPVLRVTKQAPGSWTFSNAVPGGDNCPRGKECSGSVSGTSGGQAVSEAAAKKAAAPVLKALGQDEAKLDAGQLMGAVRVVNADPPVDGLPTHGWSTGIRVGTDGTVVGGSGKLAGAGDSGDGGVRAPAKGETYPVLSADKTLDLLNQAHPGRVMPGACVDDPSGQDLPGGRDCGQPGGGATPRQSQEASVRGATFGLATHYTSGHPVLVPSWLFDVAPKGADDGYTVAYPAVDPKYLTDGSGGGSDGTPTPGDSASGTGKAHITSYTATGHALTVTFYGGVCTTYTAAARESAGEVTVTVTTHAKDTGRACIQIAKEFTRTVTLDKPLDERKVVDGSTGDAVRQG